MICVDDDDRVRAAEGAGQAVHRGERRGGFAPWRRPRDTRIDAQEMVGVGREPVFARLLDAALGNDDGCVLRSLALPEKNSLAKGNQRCKTARNNDSLHSFSTSVTSG